MAKTRGVFALITKGNCILLSERMDGKGWNLPGGRVEEGESDQIALIREVKEETGLDVEVLYQVGPDHVFNDDTAIALACKVVGGQLTITTEAKNHAWVNAREVRQGYFYNPEYDDMGNRTFENEQKFDVKLIGPEGRLGRTGRMVWDAFSLMEEPISDRHPPKKKEFSGITITTQDHYVCLGAYFYRREFDDWHYCWPRLDPYSPTGHM